MTSVEIDTPGEDEGNGEMTVSPSDREEHSIEAAVVRDLCVGSGPCFVVAPRAFQLDENMKAMVLDTSLESREALLEAARSCPTQAIFLSVRGKALYPD